MQVTVTGELLDDGTFRVSCDSEFLILRSLEDLAMFAASMAMDDQVLGFSDKINFVMKESAGVDTDDDAGFESDLNYLMTKNAELYRRLAQ